ncbi:MAG: MFS transporter [Muribaculaceae bacterium]|nr:MFS transporter [Muribaculaceae bacterium]MDE7190468.1 MFS transporter [Muribaculaceae bacterium]
MSDDNRSLSATAAVAHCDAAAAWRWIPTLYIAEGLPYFAVNTLTILMYINMGIDKSDMAFLTGWLYLPWVIKPFWSPFIDLFSTKRRWAITMQLLIAVCMACVAFLLPFPFYLTSTLICFWLMAFFSATHDIAADGYYMLALTPHDQAAFVGVRSTFYRVASVLGQGGLVMLAGHLEQTMSSVGRAWSMVFALLSVLFLLMALWHSRMMPPVTSDHAEPGVTARTIVRDFADTFVTFFRRPGIAGALAFMLLYRLPEALCVKFVPVFLVAPRKAGGLALTTAQVGWVNGTVGVIALLAGGITGGLAIAAGGLRRWLWPMALSLTLPCALYCWLALVQPDSFLSVNIAIGIEQFGYGFGFTAFMLYLLYFSRGDCATSHYAFCTAFMALGMMLPGMAAGAVFDLLAPLDLLTPPCGERGFFNFFCGVMLCCLPTFVVCSLVHIDPSFGRKKD